ncbi:MAG: hypothetical protein K6G10_04010 [Butyrivibrio sp.]|nr:hypothetical protein [Butyrivibrio sp.]
MSYKPQPPTGDSINDMFSRLADFVNIAPNLLKASSKNSFEVWFEKLELIDKRSLYYYLKEHKNEIPREYLDMVRERFPREI